MSALTTTGPATAPAFVWPGDVLDYARRHHVEPYLDPLLRATQRLFPTAHSLRVYVDPYALDFEPGSLLFEVRVATADVPDYIVATEGWTEELFRVYPPPIRFNFVLLLRREDA